MVAYNTSVGIGDTHDFASDFSFLGFSFDWRAALLATLAALALFRFKVGVLALVVGAALLGMALSFV